MKLGILGLEGVGKSTVFDLLTESYEGPEYAAGLNKPRIKVVKVEDPRLDRLAADYCPKKTTPVSFELYDFPAAPADRSRAGIADLLAPARALDALYVVLRSFASPGLPLPDAERDLSGILGEFLLADLVVVERRLERLRDRSRKPQWSDDDRKEQELLGRIREHLEADRLLSAMEFTDDETKRLSGFGFLSAKPLVVVVNCDEGAPPSCEDSLSESSGFPVIATSALSELEILKLPVEDQKVFFEEYGIEERSRDRLIEAAFRAAARISFFTVGDKEVRAWTIREGVVALEAAGQVHTDMARGFIRAEIVRFEDYAREGGVKGAKEKGLYRVEGKDYVIRDGDIVLFRFSV